MNNSSSKISSFSIILTFVFFTIVGLALVSQLPVKLSPSETLPQINVSFSMYGSSPVVVEREVSSKLEAMLGRMTGVRKINSNSGNGWGHISIELDKHADPDAARFEVSTIIRQAWPNLPENLSYPAVSLRSPDDNSKKVFLSYTLNAPAPPIIIQQYAEERIKNHLAQIKGVYQVNVSGANPMEWQLKYDYKQLELMGVSTDEIKTAINRYLKKESLGLARFDTEKNDVSFIRVALVSDINNRDIENALSYIEVKKINGRIIRLSDIVTICKTESQPFGYYRINGQNTIYISVVADETSNQLKLGNQIKTKIAALQNEFSAAYKLQKAYDATEYINEELNKIYFRTGLTVLILLVFVVLVYRKLKYTLLISISLVVNISISLIFYYLFQVEIQLYSLAGLSISLTLIIDNVIVLSDQIINRGNKKAFLAILAATLTTIGSLTIIFFMDEKIRLSLKYFAAVIIINLLVSLLVSLFLVPALIEKLKLVNNDTLRRSRKSMLGLKINRSEFKSKRLLVHFIQFYALMIRFLWKKRVLVFLIVVLLFGIPVFLLPDKIEKKNRFADIYNQTIGSNYYKENLRSHVNNILGGTWRLFVQKVYNGSYLENNREETSLFVTATLPNGSTLTQMNNLIQRMEAYVGQFPEVRQFETNIYSANRANINIRFTKPNQKNSFPHQLKSNLISKSLELGGGSWSVYGVGDGFSNDIRESAGSYRIQMYGYNYDELYEYAEKLKLKLLGYRRIKEVLINSEFSWYKDDYQEFYFELNDELLASGDIQPYQLFTSVKPYFEKNIYVGQIQNFSDIERITLQSKQSTEYNVWDLKNRPVKFREKEVKLSNLASIEKYQAPQKISKENQQYRLCLQYEYIGAYEQGRKVLETNVEAFQKELPIGYTVKSDENQGWGWGKEENKQYWLLGIVAVIIYFCSSILFNSLRQPLHIIFIIPLSFIGIFLTFYWFKLNFDQGGFAAFILLSGLTVNTNIYIINEYNNILKTRKISPLQAYIKAWNAKIRPIFLTVISTILGFVPFIVGYKESFWFPLAAGTIGGLVVSFLVVFLILPVFMTAKSFTKQI
ncbi:MAG: efflux RND transporter permease subunit [Paludibacter sp.]|nr:efflux RND transporter permease subunit [Paludibacter sp.]